MLSPAALLPWLLVFSFELTGMGSGVAQDLPEASRRGQVLRQPPSPEVAVEPAPDPDAVLRVVHTFYRDLDARQWNDVQNYFWPAKVAARWPPPFRAPKESPSDPPSGHSSASDPAGPREARLCDDGVPGRDAITFVGSWARVAGEPCEAKKAAGPESVRFDELWLLKFQGVWKIVYVR